MRVEGDIFDIAIGIAVGFNHGNNPINERPDAEGKPAEDKFADADSNLAAQETVDAETTKEEVPDPNENMFIDFSSAGRSGFWRFVRSYFLNDVSFSVFVDFYFVFFFRVWIGDTGDWDSDNFSVISANFYGFLVDF